MASVTGVSAVMYGSRSGSGNQPTVRRLAEAASKTFLQGVPVQLVAGYLQEWDGATVAFGIVGISMEAARNRSAAGASQIINTPPAVANEPNAVVIQVPPFDDGKLNIYQSENDTYFFGQVGVATAAQAMVGVQYGLTKDTDNHWYVDTSKTTVGTNTVVTIVGLDDWDPRGVYYQFTTGAQQQA
jgi:hypothetical protein